MCLLKASIVQYAKVFLVFIGVSNKKRKEKEKEIEMLNAGSIDTEFNTCVHEFATFFFFGFLTFIYRMVNRISYPPRSVCYYTLMWQSKQ